MEEVHPNLNIAVSNFKEIELNFGDIGIIKNIESELDNKLVNYETELNNISSVFDANKILMDKKYASENLKKKINEIFKLERFKLYFKFIPKESSKKKTGENKSKENKKFKIDNNEQKDNLYDINTSNKEIKDEKANKENKNQQENLNEINEQNTKKKIEQEKEKSSISSEINKSDNTKQSISSISSLDLNRLKNEINNSKFLLKKIINEINSKDEDILIGTDYETRVKTYFKLFLDYCSEQDLKIESNPGRNIEFIYKEYEKLLSLDINVKNKIIKNDSKNCKPAKFDIIIHDVNKETLLNMKKCLDKNVLSSSNLDNLDQTKNYDMLYFLNS